MNQVLRAFTLRSAGADVALVFYAGHGLEMDGVNYVVPVDARLERDTDVRFETVTLDDLLAVTAGASLRLLDCPPTAGSRASGGAGAPRGSIGPARGRARPEANGRLPRCRRWMVTRLDLPSWFGAVQDVQSGFEVDGRGRDARPVVHLEALDPRRRRQSDCRTSRYR